MLWLMLVPPPGAASAPPEPGTSACVTWGRRDCRLRVTVFLASPTHHCCFIDPGGFTAYGLKKGDVSTSAPVTPGFFGHLHAFSLQVTLWRVKG